MTPILRRLRNAGQGILARLLDSILDVEISFARAILRVKTSCDGVNGADLITIGFGACELREHTAVYSALGMGEPVSKELAELCRGYYALRLHSRVRLLARNHATTDAAEGCRWMTEAPAFNPKSARRE